eukprot:754594-Hanusia_phi.AAC.4
MADIPATRQVAAWEQRIDLLQRELEEETRSLKMEEDEEFDDCDIKELEVEVEARRTEVFTTRKVNPHLQLLL